ncbi:hypothetical protein SAMN04489723_10193 [Algoriphagus aquimarinus]|uniref:Uncharacterized protein n=1 Tax=Algoriphagus aquimarinus TaxID=237018 RepID=A0A1I0VA76_9BACT|nr:hypothetical protein SAMN04489723_10193 [Algoriphagus aquimarinus]
MKTALFVKSFKGKYDIGNTTYGIVITSSFFTKL